MTTGHDDWAPGLHAQPTQARLIEEDLPWMNWWEHQAAARAQAAEQWAGERYQEDRQSRDGRER